MSGKDTATPRQMVAVAVVTYLVFIKISSMN